MKPSEGKLVEHKSPDELRFLKDHIKTIRSDPEVGALAEMHDQSQPRFTLEAFQTGVLIDGFPCRLTIGTLALLRATRSRCIGYGSDTSPLSDQDIAQAVFLLSDEYRNQAVSCADDADELARAVSKFVGRLSLNRASIELCELLRRIGDAMREAAAPAEEGSTLTAPDPDVFHAPDDSWADDVDLLCHEYGWRDDYVLWELPIVRMIRLKESMGARRSGQSRTSRRADSGIALLKAIESKGGEALQKEPAA